MTEGSNHKRVQRKSLCFQRLREEQLRGDKLFSSLLFPAVISHDRLFNNTLSLHHTPVCLMVSPRENYSDISSALQPSCMRVSVEKFFGTCFSAVPPPPELSLSLPKCECTDLLMSKDKASSIW